MTCAEFQKVLPYIIETGGNAEEDQHLRACPVCSDLVQDLKYIAEQAKLLVPMEDPAPHVWDGIRGSLEREGMIKPARARGRLLGPIPWIGALGAFMTGSNTNSNVVFALLQLRTAEILGIPVAFILAGQTAGAGLASVVAPAKIAVGTSTADLAGREGEVMRKMLPYILVLVLLTSLITGWKKFWYSRATS